MSTDSTTTQPRALILCFDGTTNQYSAENTNVVKFYALLDKSCPLDQVVYYQPGIGTYFNPGVVRPALTWLAKIADDAVAWYLNEHVIGGYKFLMQNYRAGDKICLFGFSRGAYTARALAGFLNKIGLLPRDNGEQVPFAYSLYERIDKAGLELAAGFKRTYSMSVIIDFIGVWDTVASVGLIYSRSLPFTSSNSAVRIFRHALSLDEHRARFLPNMFHRESPEEAVKHKGKPVDPEGEGPSSEAIPPVEEVWFVGCHSDVGGGAVEDTVSYSLADITLKWMVKQVVLARCGIRFDITALRNAGIDASTIALITPAGPIVEMESEPETEFSPPTPPGGGGGGEYTIQRRRNKGIKVQAQTQQEDASASIHDELRMHPIWWILEFLPIKFTWQGPDRRWRSRWGINVGRGRQIRDERPKFHDSVRQRMDMPELKYKPMAKWVRGTEQYVD